jgi:hypothetical protein
MKRDHFFSQHPHRPARVASALLVAALSGLVGASIDWGPLDPSLRALDASPALLQNRAGVPDHALLSASDIERALPVPTHTAGLTVSTAS